MRNHLPSAAALLPPAAQFGAVGYGCTSGSTLIGPETVAALVGGAVRTHMVSNPLSAALAALAALGIARVGIVSPYIASVAGPLADAFRAAGHQVPHTLSFGEEVEERVARIDPASIKAAALDLAATGDIDAVFMSCTNLRTLDVITEIERVENAIEIFTMLNERVLTWACVVEFVGVTVTDEIGRDTTSVGCDMRDDVAPQVRRCWVTVKEYN